MNYFPFSRRKRGRIKKHHRKCGSVSAYGRRFCSDNPPQGFGLLIGQAADNFPPGHQSYEAVVVVHHGDKILIHGAVQQFFHGDSDWHGRVAPRLKNILNLDVLQVLHIQGIHCQNLPEEIPLADGSQITPLSVDDRNGSIAMVPHFLQALPQGIIPVQIGDPLLRLQQKSNIHMFLFSGPVVLPSWELEHFQLISGISDIYNIQEKPRKMMNSL